MKFIADHNEAAAHGLESFTLDVNENADLTLEEFVQYKLGVKVENETLDDASEVRVASGLTQSSLPSDVGKISFLKLKFNFEKMKKNRKFETFKI